ncbi:uncharacterized protein V6R79_013743 [Siganus canaliculatus]
MSFFHRQMHRSDTTQQINVPDAITLHKSLTLIKPQLLHDGWTLGSSASLAAAVKPITGSLMVR